MLDSSAQEFCIRFDDNGRTLVYGRDGHVADSRFDSARHRLNLFRRCLDQGLVNDPAELITIGSELYGALFCEDKLLKAFQRERNGDTPIRLVLHFNGSVTAIQWPWEYLYDPTGGFLGSNGRILISRRFLGESNNESFVERATLKILVAQSEPVSSSGLLLTLQAIQRECGAALELDFAETGNGFRDRFENAPPDILHFIGNVEPTSNLVFRDESIPVSELLAHKGLRLVFLQAGNTPREGTYEGLGACVVELAQTIPIVVSTAAPMPAGLPDKIATLFYSVLRSGRPVDEAVHAGRHELAQFLQANEFHSRAFGGLIAYLKRPSHTLRFPAAPKAHSDLSSSGPFANAAPELPRPNPGPSASGIPAAPTNSSTGLTTNEAPEPLGMKAVASETRTIDNFERRSSISTVELSSPRNELAVVVKLDASRIYTGLSDQALECSQETDEFIGDKYDRSLQNLRSTKDKLDKSMVEQIGEALFAVFMTPTVKAAYKAKVDVASEDNPLELQVHLLPTLDAQDPWRVATLPWELMRDPSGPTYLGCAAHVHMTRRFPIEPRRSWLVPNAAMSMSVLLGCAAPDGYTLDLHREMTALDTLSNESRGKLRLNKSPDRLTRQNIAGRFNETSRMVKGAAMVFHFSGHGERGKLVLEDGNQGPDPFDSGHLGSLLVGRPYALAVISACLGATAPTASEGNSSSVALALVQAGVPSVVAMDGKLIDIAAPPFVKSFYASLLQAESPAKAITAARQQLCTVFQDYPGMWALPVIYAQTPSSPLIVPAEPLRGYAVRMEANTQ